jgi:hypothetical protein
MSLNSSVALSMPVNPEAQGVEREKNNSVLVSESSYPMDNVPTRQTTTQSYALEGNELSRDTIPFTTVYEGQKNGCTCLHRRGERKLVSLDAEVCLPRSLLHPGQKN